MDKVFIAVMAVAIIVGLGVCGTMVYRELRAMKDWSR